MMKEANLTDLKRIVEIYDLTWGELGNNYDELIEGLKEGSVFVYEHDARIVCYAILVEDTRGFFELTDIATHPQFAGLGFAKKLLYEVVKLRRPLRLMVEKDNVPALKLYSRLGFRNLGTHENYYGIGEDGIRLGKEVLDEPN